MSQNITDNFLAGGFLAMWVITFIFYHYKRRVIDAGTAIMSLYIIYAFFSLMSINDEVFAIAYEPLRFFPYLYLFIMMLIAMAPVTYNHLIYTTQLEDTNSRILTLIGWIVALSAILMLPKLMSNSSGGILAILSDSTSGKEAYMEQVEEAQNAGSGINNIFAIIYNAFSDFPAFLFFYILCKEKKNKPLLIALGITMLIGIYVPISKGQRGGTVTGMLTIIGGFMLFYRYLSVKIKKIIHIMGAILILVITIPIAAITISRFGQEQGGVTSFIYWYVGQGTLYFNNYGLDAGGTRNGDRTMNMVKRTVDSSTPKNYDERRDKYHILEIDDYYFTTFVGDFTIDFGPVASVFIFIIFNSIVIYLIRLKEGKLKLHQLMPLYLTICIQLQGGMTLYSYADLGMLRILTLSGVYTYLRYHEKLIEHFPKYKER
jgi:oligosaccharide repeat unit polymerase